MQLINIKKYLAERFLKSYIKENDRICTIIWWLQKLENSKLNLTRRETNDFIYFGSEKKLILKGRTILLYNDFKLFR